MTVSNVRAFLALGAVGISMLVVAVLALYPLFANVEHVAWADIFGKMVSPFIGLVGVIVGYYFGQKD
jgi:hypothetical protein